jgi:hypothetical protein
MPRMTVNSGPGAVDLPIVRGDDVSYPIALYTAYTSESVNTPLDITGRTYSSAIAATKGGAVVATPTVTVTSAATGKITWSLTDTQTDALTAGRYVWDLVENPGTSSERTLIIGTLRITGRATA